MRRKLQEQPYLDVMHNSAVIKRAKEIRADDQSLNLLL